MNSKNFSMKLFVMSMIASLPGLAGAFESGSTGADGALMPTVNTVVAVPPSGVLNYTSVNIPSGVTVTFRKNAANTPVVMLVGGNATIAGAIDIRGRSSANSGTAGDGNQGDDGMPGMGGPGGFDGGRGGIANSLVCSNVATSEKTRAGSGLGPGGGAGGRSFNYGSYYGSYCITGGGGGGGYAGPGQASYIYRNPGYIHDSGANFGAGGKSYGSNLIIPLIGGSGGGGGSGGATYVGAGGGGGGGALLIAASGTVHIPGGIYAAGGSGGATSGPGQGGAGAGGAGGAIRIIASTISGNGTLNAGAGTRGANSPDASGLSTRDDFYQGNVASVSAAGNGAAGRIRLEAGSITFSSSTSPAYTKDAPGSVFIAGLPSLTIASVGGVNAPANPTGQADITLPVETTNPVTVTFQTSNVPLGNTVVLTVSPAYGNQIVAQSPAITGSTESGAASVQVSLPKGPSVLQATTTYTIVAALGDALSTYANNERVGKIQLIATLGGASMTKLITVSGKEFVVPTALLATMGG